jgi:hypothetical protein
MTPSVLGDFVNILGELGFLAVQVRNSYIYKTKYPFAASLESSAC